MSAIKFQKAKPMQAFYKGAVYGPPGSGKTYTTLMQATGLAEACGKRIAYVDTERGTRRETHQERKCWRYPNARMGRDQEAIQKLDPLVNGL